MRIQVLYLPSLTVGEMSGTRFALVFDQVEQVGDNHHLLGEFAQQVGAAGALVYPGTIDVVQGDETDESGDDQLSPAVALDRDMRWRAL